MADEKKEGDGIVYMFVPRSPLSIDIGDDVPFVFDATVEEVHDAEVQITENPVEFGANISDHAFVLPRRITISGRITDFPLVDNLNDIFTTSTTEENSTRSADAWFFLNKLKDERQPLIIYTYLQNYQNMVIRSLKTTQDALTARVLDVEMELQEIIVVKAPTTEYDEGEEYEPGELEISFETQPEKVSSDSFSPMTFFTEQLNTLGSM
jgi:hypothetical protein